MIRHCNTLRTLGIPVHLIALLHSLYDNQTATVRIEFGNTEQFRIGKGVRQGCILSPTLFNLYAEKIMKDADLDNIAIGVRNGGKTINNLRYADDTTLAAESEAGLRTLLEKVNITGEKS